MKYQLPVNRNLNTGFSYRNGGIDGCHSRKPS